MIKKILIANRGEIALRIIRTCKEMGIKTVALCPLPGQESNFLETSLANEHYFLDKEGAQGYLDQKKIIEIAKKARADAIHPGYGFLAENWRFAKFCQKQNIKFIGPHFKVLKKLEDKIEAKKLAQKVGIPVLSASDGSIKTKDDLFKWAFKIKPPFVLKARKGGGGIGIRIVNGHFSFGELFSTAASLQRQMGLAFSDIDFFLEKYLSGAKHIEFQILGDGNNFVHLGERECTIQRRFQKLLEEAPSLFLDESKRKEMGGLAIKLGRELRYKGAATVEFLVDEAKNFYFLEVNPRIQVEHPVTEAVTGVDIVEQQIRIAQGENIPFSQSDILFNGWAIEARINGEDCLRKFQPGPGTIEKYLPPGGQGIFLHTFLKEGQEIYPYFDSLLAKLIAWGKTREEAIRKLSRALDEMTIEGIPTTIPFFKALLKNKDFLVGNFNTDFVEISGILEELEPPKTPRKIPKFKEKYKEGKVVLGEIEKKEVAKLIFQIYQSVKKFVRTSSMKKTPSRWVMAERLKMFE